ncbi:adenosylmethionine decarboxylase [Duganella qianjiadongensis]|uniref:S-adenosylmethionine decarboxylase proenzyme n=1 Tax=Duganella qianjiadongensis TaxID=2692176 RepID=A0ABW9VQU7_9BURK|nr:adenosylmethionine decarboxylase [Duganella qianjiadongensis]MYM41325.1 adenosylmethionine decarboxylase [Duganella qianjiadongensis]
MKRVDLPELAANAIHHPAGQHLLADLSGVEPQRLSDCATLELLLRQAALAAGAHVLFSHFHGFGTGLGVTGVVLLAESHITIHTWPENGYAAADIFMCGAAQPELALAVIEQALAPASRQIRSIARHARQPG